MTHRIRPPSRQSRQVMRRRAGAGHDRANLIEPRQPSRGLDTRRLAPRRQCEPSHVGRRPPCRCEPKLAGASQAQPREPPRLGWACRDRRPCRTKRSHDRQAEPSLAVSNVALTAVSLRAVPRPQVCWCWRATLPRKRPTVDLPSGFVCHSPVRRRSTIFLAGGTPAPSGIVARASCRPQPASRVPPRGILCRGTN